MYDVVVVGGGNAGLCAAITARALGVSVLLLEAAPRAMRGGNSRHTRNLRAMHDAPLATLTGRYPFAEYLEDLERVTQGRMTPELAELTIRESPPLVQWLVEQGVRFQPALSGTLSLDRTNAFFLGGGCALVNALYRRAEALGVEIRYGHAVREIVIRNGRFASLKAMTSDNDTREIEGKSLVVASGGFQANEDWMVEAWGEAARNFLIRGTPYNTGTVLRQLMSQGFATVAEADQCHAVAIDARAPKYDGGIVSRLDCVAFGIVVNQEGCRFYDEGEDFWPKRYAIWGRLIARQPGQIAYAVIDSKVTDQFMPSLYPPLSADSLEDLALRIGVEGDALTDTVSRFNHAVQRQGSYDHQTLDGCATLGLTPDKTNWALPIDKPPFHAYPLRPGITFTYLGLKVNQRAQAMRVNGDVCVNVFAAGEVMAGNILGQGYCAGTGMTIGGVFGRIAGKGAAEAATA